DGRRSGGPERLADDVQGPRPALIQEDRLRPQAVELRSQRTRNLEGRAVSTESTTHHSPLTAHQTSGTYTPGIIEDIQTKAELGRYRIRGFGILRPRTWATFDDLTFIPCGLTRIPLEGYRESCSTKTVLGKRFAATPIELEIPVMITGMSFGALSYNP